MAELFALIRGDADALIGNRRTARPCSSRARIEMVEPDGEYFAAFSRIWPQASSIRPESTLTSGKSSANSLSILCAANRFALRLWRRIDDVPWIRPFAASG